MTKRNQSGHELITFQIIDITNEDQSIIIFGRDENNKSLIFEIPDFETYFYVRVRMSMEFNIFEKLIKRYKLCYSYEENFKNIYGFEDSWNDSIQTMRIKCSSPKELSKAKYTFRQFHQFESDLSFLMRFMIDKDISGVCWVQAYGQRCESFTNITTNSYYIGNHELFKKLETKSNVADFSIMSIDIECLGNVLPSGDVKFPEAEFDPIIQIAVCTTQLHDFTNIKKSLFCFKSCDPIDDCDVKWFESEQDMLLAFEKEIQIKDPDIITGYNVVNFDLNYILNRANHLEMTEYGRFGRKLEIQSKAKEKIFQSNQAGCIEYIEINTEGRIQIDMLSVIKKDHKLRSYKLNNVSKHFIQDEKEDLPYNEIPKLYGGDSKCRAKIGEYCVKDAILPILLMNKLQTVFGIIEMARISAVPINYILFRGQQVRVLSQIYRVAKKQKYIIPVIDEMEKAKNQPESYEGATVIDPIVGYYDKPITTLDFASLYPSIMMAHNLCYSSIVFPQNQITIKSKYKSEDYTITPSGDMFMKPHIVQGILPMILVNLITARKQVKNLLKDANSDMEKAILNARQLALKVNANSVYGYTGTATSHLPCVQIASSVTSFGREMINKTKELVESKYPGAKVIYGDTDSVMINFNKSLEECMVLGKEAADYISSTFLKPIKLEFEKCYYPYLLLSKKKYAGMLYTNPTHPDKMDCKGLENVRRDYCQLLSITIQQSLNYILIDKSIEMATDYVKKVIKCLILNIVPIELLVISKTLAKEEYATPQLHTALVKKLKQRNLVDVPKVGDRVEYIITAGHPNSSIFERVEDPHYAKIKNIPIDIRYYIDHQLREPITRLFQNILKNMNELFLQTELVQIRNVGVSKLGMGKFVIPKKTCKVCNVSSKHELCETCHQNKSLIIENLKLELKSLNSDYCSNHTSLCTAHSCKFYFHHILLSFEQSKITNKLLFLVSN